MAAVPSLSGFAPTCPPSRWCAGSCRRSCAAWLASRAGRSWPRRPPGRFGSPVPIPGDGAGVDGASSGNPGASFPVERPLDPVADVLEQVKIHGLGDGRGSHMRSRVGVAPVESGMASLREAVLDRLQGGHVHDLEVGRRSVRIEPKRGPPGGGFGGFPTGRLRVRIPDAPARRGAWRDAAADLRALAMAFMSPRQGRLSIRTGILQSSTDSRAVSLETRGRAVSHPPASP